MPDSIHPFVIVALVLFVIGIGTLFVRQVMTLKTQTTMNAPQTAPTTSVVSTSQLTYQTAGWKTYRNDKYGFQFEYPASWKLIDDGAGVSLDSDPTNTQEHGSMIIKAFPEDRGETIGEISEFNRINLNQDCKKITFANLPAYDCNPSITFAGDHLLIFVKDGLTFEIDDSVLNQNSSKVISSFKFTN
ncbi:MAG: hypothetical protein HYT40_02730 [Candidatus Sungbacteria bacterium]|uniref:Uncharacterized protein n=1 Tax=Candidatus Sungiibacteriota bacterium TaxID=2750080 RepID=A0A931SDL3_9BACT|nr:hypothetical protein [Candidatus Sungbacteria bacterium]